MKDSLSIPMIALGAAGTFALASLFHRQTAVIDHLDPDLTIRGLILIHAHHATASR